MEAHISCRGTPFLMIMGDHPIPALLPFHSLPPIWGAFGCTQWSRAVLLCFYPFIYLFIYLKCLKGKEESNGIFCGNHLSEWEIISQSGFRVG